MAEEFSPATGVATAAGAQALISRIKISVVKKNVLIRTINYGSPLNEIFTLKMIIWTVIIWVKRHVV